MWAGLKLYLIFDVLEMVRRQAQVSAWIESVSLTSPKRRPLWGSTWVSWEAGAARGEPIVVLWKEWWREGGQAGQLRVR